MNPQVLLAVDIREEADVVLARQRARHIAELLGFDKHDQTRVATAVSEIGRNAQQYARGGRAEFALCAGPPASLLITVGDKGPGIANLERVLNGQYTSPTGMGLGIVGSRRLMDHLTIDAPAGQGTTVSMRKYLPAQAKTLTPARLNEVVQTLARQKTHGQAQELRQQNQELMVALDRQREANEDLRTHQLEVERLAREMEDTNKGVLALYAELDSKAEELRRVSELKTKFLSYMSHEFRTPLGSIRSVARLLADRMDGPLTGEQEKQVSFIQKAATDLTDLVNDMLDLAKIEAGRLTLAPARFTLADLLAALRGMFRPVTLGAPVQVNFDEPGDALSLYTDEQKLSQILRNFISNALKFTKTGEVRVSATYERGGEITLHVRDTGIGIAPEHQEIIFLDFTQVESPLQRGVRGTGLGLPLSKKLAELLGGRISLVSAPGEGSTFSISIPMELPVASNASTTTAPLTATPGIKP